MINFRFHLISLTAVFLSFAVGLLLGTNFLADASKNYLEDRLDTFADRLNDEEATNDELSAQVGSLESEGEQLDEQVGERLFTGLLTADPVLVVAPRGLQGDTGPVERVLDSLAKAGADARGVWWLTDRLVLDDEDEATELAQILGLNDTDPVALRNELGARLASVLAAATDAGDATSPDLTAAQAEPDLLAQLNDAGFVDYQLAEGDDSEVVTLPTSGLRVVTVTGEGAVLTGDQVVLPMLSGLAAEGPVPVVLAETPVVPDDDPETDDEGDPLVAQIRADGTLGDRISTVDDVDRVSGRIATMLALDDAVPSAPVVGHYGLRPDADRLLPAPPEE
ncbi:MAG TPA: copper transporter [Acidimicrobiales bacterium]|nr:copper transporter [Acidimicrobiales bacterium]